MNNADVIFYMKLSLAALFLIVLGLAIWLNRSTAPKNLSPEQLLARKRAIRCLVSGDSVSVVSDDQIITIRCGDKVFYFETKPSMQFHNAEAAIMAAEALLQYVVDYEIVVG